MSTLLISSFERSILLNSQLAYNNKATISFIYTKQVEDNSFYSSSDLITDIYDISQFKIKDYSSIPIFKLNTDTRLLFFKFITQSNTSNLSIYFPLTQEKYIFTCLSKKINPFENDSFIKEGKSEIYKEYSHINQINDYIDKNSNILIEDFWKNLSEEEKLAFDVLEPGTIKSKDINIYDIDRFESQEKIEPMKNFGVVFFIPVKTERTIYPKPQVISNTRKQNFESVYQPRKTIKKYEYILKRGEFDYDIHELNV